MNSIDSKQTIHTADKQHFTANKLHLWSLFEADKLIWGKMLLIRDFRFGWNLFEIETYFRCQN